VRAAARGYFGMEMAELTLAEFAIIAAFPQSPTKFDLVRIAEVDCLVPAPEPTAAT
jgi:membrane peptidoglycan carboxypeptidase